MKNQKLLFGALGLGALAGVCTAARLFLVEPELEVAAPVVKPLRAPETAHFYRGAEKLLEAGEPDKALASGRAWQQSHPREAEGFVIVGRALQMKGDLDGAILNGQKAKSLNSRGNWTWLAETQRIRQRFPNLQFFPLVPVKSTAEIGWKALSGRAQPMLKARKYDEIERNVAQLLASRAQLPGGNWKLAAFALPLCEVGSDEATWSANNAQLQAWHKARPDSKLASLMLGRSWSEGANIARGYDYANKVTAKQWALMNQRLTAAAPLLSDSLGDIKTTPLVFSGIQYWAILGQVPRPIYEKAWKEAIAAFPAYAPFYQQKARFLMTRWYGRPGEWEAFARNSADQIGGARGDMMYASIVIAQSENYDTEFFDNNAVSWPRTKRGVRALIARSGDPIGEASAAQRLAAIARDGAFERELFRGPLAHSFAPLGKPKADLAVLCRNRIRAFAGE